MGSAPSAFMLGFVAATPFEFKLNLVLTFLLTAAWATSAPRLATTRRQREELVTFFLLLPWRMVWLRSLGRQRGLKLVSASGLLRMPAGVSNQVLGMTAVGPTLE